MIVTILVLVDSVLQYNGRKNLSGMLKSRNPCFSGQCFAIEQLPYNLPSGNRVAILVLVDSVLQ